MKPNTFLSYRKKFFSQHSLLTILLVLFRIGASLSSLIPPLVLKRLIDNVLHPEASFSIDKEKLWLYASLYLLSYLLISVFDILNSLLIDTIGAKLIHSLRRDRRKKRHSLPSSYFRHHGSGSLSSRIRDDVASVESLFTDGIVSLIVSALKIISILVSVFVFSWLLGIRLFIRIPIVFLITLFFRKRRLKQQVSIRKKENQLSNRLSESLSSFETIENLNKEEYQEERFDQILKENRDLRNRSAIYDAAFSPIIRALRALRISLVTLLVFYFRGSTSGILGLSVGTFAAALSRISNLFAPIQDLGQEIQVRQEGTSGLKRAMDFLNLEEKKKENGSLSVKTILSDDSKVVIEVNHLSFHYPDSDINLLQDVSFNLKEEDKVLLLGRTGAGKTTLFRRLRGRESPSQGMITLNHIPRDEIPDKAKKKIFGYVSQGFKPISGTIRDQITLHDTSLTLEQVRKARKDSFLDDYVREHIPNGYQAPFSRGDFSQGQLELLNLARALVNEPKILLLDELSSNIDTATEEKLLSALAKAGEGRRRISITHRLSNKLSFNRVLEVEDCKVREKDIRSLE